MSPASPDEVRPDRAGARPSFGTARLAEDTRERFLREIVARLPSDRLDECFLFPPIRQGGAESGVAVLALRQPLDAAPTADADASVVDLTPDGDPTEAAAGEAPASDGASSEGSSTEGSSTDALASASPAAAPARERHVVYVARYRLLVKGPERGRWEIEVRAEADAPLITVEEVVRGVGRRAGDASEPTRLDGAAVARLLGHAGAPPPVGVPAR